MFRQAAAVETAAGRHRGALSLATGTAVLDEDFQRRRQTTALTPDQQAALMALVGDLITTIRGALGPAPPAASRSKIEAWARGRLQAWGDALGLSIDVNKEVANVMDTLYPPAEPSAKPAKPAPTPPAVSPTSAGPIMANLLPPSRFVDAGHGLSFRRFPPLRT